ncbi:GNAT family N-acetyltransferase [Vibrio viridaestus]|uniref:GNAT family N-acetyltransferase n=1 Tax=Vibrio viridaestus TaxID=2487322 RepID=A0A3N9TES8_9VIBR|nr:GNAT family N-acetyltransferase [Vibrio viridaestus]RQW62223.1 GNAT family N-acetyltransferase [Vibrio viridaestus]
MNATVQQIRSELRYLVRELGLLDKNCLNSGLSLSQAHLMTYLHKNGQTSFSELGTQLNIEKASLSRTLNNLLNQALIHAYPESTDKRQKRFELSTLGIERLGEADTAANETLGRLIPQLSLNEAEEVISGLRALRLCAFRNNASIDPSRVQIEELTTSYKEDVLRLIHDTFAKEQAIPEDLVPLPDDTPQYWWVARSGEYILGAAAGWYENEEWHWGRFVVDSRFRQLGIGLKLASYSLHQLLTMTDSIYIEARDITVSIVERLGGQIVGKPFDFYGMPVTPMRLARLN